METTDPSPHYTLDDDAIYEHWGVSVRKHALADGKVVWMVEGAYPFGGGDGRVFTLNQPSERDAVAPSFTEWLNHAYHAVDLVCMDAQTGKALWKAPVPTENPVAVGQGGVALIQSGLKPPVVAEQEVLVGTFGGRLFKGRTGKLYAYSLVDGKPLWAFEAEDGVEHAPLIYKDLALIGGVAACYGVDLKTGKQVWKAETRSDNQWTFTLAGDTLLMASGHYRAQNSMSGGTLYALEAATGKVRWTFDIGGPSVLRVADGRVVGLEWGAFGGSRLTCLDLANGKKLWELKEKGTAWPVVVDGKAVHLDKDNRIHVVDLATGKAEAAIPAAGDFQMGFFSGPWGRFMDPMVLQGHAVVGSWDKGKKETVLQVLDVKQGKVIQERRLHGELQDVKDRGDLLVSLVKGTGTASTLQVDGR